MDFACLVNQFDGCELNDGTIIQAKEDMVKIVLRMGGLLGGKNAHDRAMLEELRKKMSEDQSNAATRFHQLMTTTDNTNIRRI